MSTEAFTQLVEAHYAPLHRLGLSLARHPADARDLVHQTFYRPARGENPNHGEVGTGPVRVLHPAG